MAPNNISAFDSIELEDLIETLGSEPPEHLLIDWIEFIYLLVLLCVGAPLNSAACVALNERALTYRRGNRRLETLKRHLNYCDLLLTFVYIPSRLCWTITYQWRGGWLLCKLVKFGHNLAFQMSSNVIVCVSLDRVFSILSASLIIHSETAEMRVRFMLAISWFMAVISSFPQILCHTILAKSKQFQQCTTIWDAHRYEQVLQLQFDVLNHTFHNLKNQGPEMQIPHFSETKLTQLHAIRSSEMVFFTVQQVFVFLLPVCIIGVCYVYVAFKVINLTGAVDRELNVVYNKRPSPAITGTHTTFLSSSQNKAESCIRRMQRTPSVNNDPVGAYYNNPMFDPVSHSGLPGFNNLPKATSFPEVSAPGNQPSLRNLKNLWKDKVGRGRAQFLVANEVDPESVEYHTCAEYCSEEYSESSEEIELVSGQWQTQPSTSGLLGRSTSVPVLFMKSSSSISSEQDQLYNSSQPNIQIVCNNKNRDTCCVEVPMLDVTIHRNVLRVKRKTLRVSGVLVFAYILCWLPYNLLTLASLGYPHLADEFKRSFYFLKDLVAFNAVINPFLYGMFGSLRRWARTA